FERIYPAGTMVTLEAPYTYGGRMFDHWVVNDVAQPAADAAITVVMNAPITAKAIYAPAPTSTLSPILTPLRTPGQVGFLFSTKPGSTYVVEYKATLRDPSWVVVQTFAGTGAPILFQRPAPAN